MAGNPKRRESNEETNAAYSSDQRAAASAIAGGVAWASIPDSNKVFSACMLNGVGTIRLIDKSLPATNFMSHCTDRETEVSWNQQGLQGLQGIQGPGREGRHERHEHG
jgi:hypothetical protein